MTRAEYYKRLWKIFRAYKGRKTKLDYMPVRLWIEPTSVCNLRCVMCPNKDLSKAQKGFMDFELFKKIIDEAKGFVSDVHLLHRGESLLHPRFFDMVRYAHEAGIVTRFHTNGTLLDEDKARRLIEAGLDQFAFSFDGMDKETYETIRVNADFETTVRNITRFLEIKKELGAKKPVTFIELIRFPDVFKKYDKSAQKAFLDRFKGLPLDHLHIKELHNWAGDVGQAPPKTSYSPCTFLWHALIIFWDGAVLPCTQDFFGALTLGSVKDSTIREIWNNDKMVRLREKILAHDVADLETCSQCDRLWRRQVLGIPREYLGRALRKNMN
jgi:radical SAM protein with 4Fe4S-binding SPASM domain